MTSLGSKKKAGKVDKIFLMAKQFYGILPAKWCSANLNANIYFGPVHPRASWMQQKQHFLLHKRIKSCSCTFPQPVFLKYGQLYLSRVAESISVTVATMFAATKTTIAAAEVTDVLQSRKMLAGFGILSYYQILNFWNSS